MGYAFSPDDPPPAEEGSLIERVAWAILTTLHGNVPEEDRPQSWSDLSSEQENRVKMTAIKVAAICESDSFITLLKVALEDIAAGADLKPNYYTLEHAGTVARFALERWRFHHPSHSLPIVAAPPTPHKCPICGTETDLPCGRDDCDNIPF